MNKLTPQYIDDHLKQIHTYESYGRSLSELLLQTAKKMVEENPAAVGEDGMIRFKADVAIAAVQPMACISAEVCALLGCVTVHVGVN